MEPRGLWKGTIIETLIDPLKGNPVLVTLDPYRALSRSLKGSLLNPLGELLQELCEGIPGILKRTFLKTLN